MENIVLTWLSLCICSENLSKDLYLMSQMDSDQFVPIWTIASMEGIKVLTTDMDLILDVLRCKQNNFIGGCIQMISLNVFSYLNSSHFT